MRNIFRGIRNILIYLIIFLSVFFVGTLAMARKINRYRSNFDNRTFTVEKDTIVLTNPIGGRVENILFRPGQHVQEGDVLVELSDEDYEDRLGVLDEFAESNESARTEAELLRVQEKDYTVVAPRDGIVKEVELAEGSYIPPNTRLITLYSDVDAKLITHIDSLALEEIQKTTTLEVYSKRLEQSFFIELSGINEINDTTKEYKVVFNFSDPENSAYFINGEEVEALTTQTQQVQKPSEMITNLWNNLIIQN